LWSKVLRAYTNNMSLEKDAWQCSGIIHMKHRIYISYFIHMNFLM
jgi:hypothetical protein